MKCMDREQWRDIVNVMNGVMNMQGMTKYTSDFMQCRGGVGRSGKRH